MKQELTLQDIRGKIIEYGKQRGEEWHFDEGDGKGHFRRCLDTFTLDYMICAVKWFLEEENELS